MAVMNFSFIANVSLCGNEPPLYGDCALELFWVISQPKPFKRVKIHFIHCAFFFSYSFLQEGSENYPCQKYPLCWCSR